MIVKTDCFSPSDIEKNGNKFLIGNGSLGYRGTLEEFRKTELVALNMPGIYDTVPGKWTDSLNAPNPFYTFLEIPENEETLHPLHSQILSHTQGIILDEAVHFRTTVYQTSKGSLTVSAKRFVSSVNPTLLGMEMEIMPEKPAEIVINTGIDKEVWDQFGPHLESLETGCSDGFLKYICKTQEKGLLLTVLEKISYNPGFEISEKTVDYPDRLMRTVRVRLKARQTFRFTKLAIISVDQKIEDQLLAIPYETHYRLHRENFKKKFDNANILVEGDELAQLGISCSIYHLLILSPNHRQSASIPARGLSGQVYKGAVFWDTEIFMFPFFALTAPEIAKTLLKYRIDSLPKAKEKAKEFGCLGAYYPWESIENGKEACSFFNVTDVFTNRPLRTYFKDKQIHISSAVVYALDRYFRYTSDGSFLTEDVMWVFYEVALFYYSRAYYREWQDRYVLTDVTGPDEYHERVDNNAYTNYMAGFCFDAFLKYYEIFQFFYRKTIAPMEDLKNKLPRVLAKLYLPEPNDNKIIEQFDGYFALEDIPPDELKKRMLHPNEYLGGAWGLAGSTQLIKQADVLTLLWHFRERFSVDVLKANYEYYSPRTLHTSSLSTSMYGLVATLIDKPDEAYRFFLDSALIDYEGKGSKYAGGIYIGGTHPASSGGAYMLTVWGFAGLRLDGGKISLKPHLPPQIKSLKFTVHFQGKLYRIEVTGNSGSVTEVDNP